jgi:hypothetical protein
LVDVGVPFFCLEVAMNADEYLATLSPTALASIEEARASFPPLGPESGARLAALLWPDG